MDSLQQSSKKSSDNEGEASSVIDNTNCVDDDDDSGEIKYLPKHDATLGINEEFSGENLDDLQDGQHLSDLGSTTEAEDNSGAVDSGRIRATHRKTDIVKLEKGYTFPSGLKTSLYAPKRSMISELMSAISQEVDVVEDAADPDIDISQVISTERHHPKSLESQSLNKPNPNQDGSGGVLKSNARSSAPGECNVNVGPNDNLGNNTIPNQTHTLDQQMPNKATTAPKEEKFLIRVKTAPSILGQGKRIKKTSSELQTELNSDSSFDPHPLDSALPSSDEDAVSAEDADFPDLRWTSGTACSSKTVSAVGSVDASLPAQVEDVDVRIKTAKIEGSGPSPSVDEASEVAKVELRKLKTKKPGKVQTQDTSQQDGTNSKQARATDDGDLAQPSKVPYLRQPFTLRSYEAFKPSDKKSSLAPSKAKSQSKQTPRELPTINPTKKYPPMKVSNIDSLSRTPSNLEPSHLRCRRGIVNLLAFGVNTVLFMPIINTALSVLFSGGLLGFVCLQNVIFVSLLCCDVFLYFLFSVSRSVINLLG